MYHSLTFQTLDAAGNPVSVFNTYKDLHIVPTSRPFIVPPGVKTHYIDVPGKHGSIDLTEALSGYPLYSNSSGSIDFSIYGDDVNWYTVYSTIITVLHGRRARVIFEDVKSIFYDGRWALTNWSANEGMQPTISLSYNVDPIPLSVSGVSGLAAAIANSW